MAETTTVSSLASIYRTPLDESEDFKVGDITVITIGPPFRYIIPNFEVLQVELRQIVIEGETEDGASVTYDCFIRNDPSLSRAYPAAMTVRDAVIIPPAVFQNRVDVQTMRLIPDGVFVAWQWEWLPDSQPGSESESEEDSSSVQPLTHSRTPSDVGSGSEDQEEVQDVAHTVTFKCIGASRELQTQEILAKVAKLLDRGDIVSVDLFPEPENKYDSNAIAFKCLVDGSWHRIGYVVREALLYVHDAMKKQQILSVKFAWVKYIINWSRSGPGFYAGINITKSGDWHTTILQCASTR